MTSIAELTDHIKKQIEAHPSKHAYDLNDLLKMVESLEAPVIAIHMDGGLIQDVERLNDAPFSLYVHDHDIDGADELSDVVWPGGKVEPAVISSYDHTDVSIQYDEGYWNSLRSPVDSEI